MSDFINNPSKEALIKYVNLLNKNEQGEFLWQI